MTVTSGSRNHPPLDAMDYIRHRPWPEDGPVRSATHESPDDVHGRARVWQRGTILRGPPNPEHLSMTECEVRNLIRWHAERAGSVRALAKEWGMSQAYLDKQIRGTQAVGDLTLRQLKLIRRKAFQFYPESRGGLNELASEVGAMIADHESCARPTTWCSAARARARP